MASTRVELLASSLVEPVVEPVQSSVVELRVGSDFLRVGYLSSDSVGLEFAIGGQLLSFVPEISQALFVGRSALVSSVWQSLSVSQQKED